MTEPESGGQTPDSYRLIALDAIAELALEESTTEGEFGIGDPNENYHEASEGLRRRLAELDGTITDAMVERAHNTLRGLGWNNLHDHAESGESIRDAMRSALEAALSPEREV